MPKLMVVAGEMSGDLLGAAAVDVLKKKLPTLKLVGVGGPCLRQQGLESFFDQHELSVMGLVEVIPAIPHLKRRMHELVELAKSEKPDLLLTIDSPDFNLRLARRVKQELGVPCAHYVSPSVWAWRPGRVRKMAQFLDHVLALFPFEPEYYKGSGLSCTFVGHPVAERLASYAPEDIFSPVGSDLALLPGSRKGEIRRMLPVMLQTFDSLKRQGLVDRAILPVAGSHLASLIKHLVGERSIQLIDDDAWPHIKDCRAALVTSGTANLELAMLGVPMVVGYKSQPITHFLLSCMVNVPYISPVNWVAQKAVVPEFIQNKASSGAFELALAPLLKDDKMWQMQAEQLKIVRQALHAPSETSAQRAAEVLLQYIR